jgi:integrase/recombinase XerD
VLLDGYINKLLLKINPMNKQQISPKTINRHLVSIKLFVSFLNNKDDVVNKIFVEIKSLKYQKHYYLDNLLTKNEFIRMINKAKLDGNSKAEMIFITLYYTGVRVSELISITPASIHEDILRIIGKGSKYRDIILADEIIIELHKYIRINKIGDEQLVFDTSRQTVHKLIKKYAGLCRINLKHASAHKFRHLHAIDLLDNGASIEEVADELGHTDINTTRIYTKKDKSELKKTVNRLSLYR